MADFHVEIVKESTTALADAFNAASERNNGQGPAVDVEIHAVVHWVAVTHATKNAVMSAVTPTDLKKVGCENPDIWHKKGDDLIVLTRPKSMGKGKSHTTGLHAEAVLGPDWKKKLNVHKFTTSRKAQLVMERFPNEFPKAKPFAEGDAVAFVKVQPKLWIAVVLRSSANSKEARTR